MYHDPVAFFDRVFAFPASTDRVAVAIDAVELVFVFLSPDPVQVQLLVLRAVPCCENAAEPFALVRMIRARRPEDVSGLRVDRSGREGVDVPVFRGVVQPHAFEVPECVRPAQRRHQML
jgi:hypothetical protein